VIAPRGESGASLARTSATLTVPRRSVSHGQVMSEPATLLGHSSPGTSWQDLRYVRSHLDHIDMFLLPVH
jgi:hypothetical protein